MKEDKLEQYIHNNRSSFDDAEPSDGVWNKISADFDKKDRRKISWIRIAWQAAAAVLIFFSAWYLKDAVDSTHYSKPVAMRKNIQLHPMVNRIVQPETNVQQQTVFNTGNQSVMSIAAVSQNSDTLPSELLEATQYYSEQISKTRSLMKNCASYNTEIDQQVNVEFAELDTVYKLLRNDLKENINSTEVLEAMILNYRMRLEILQSIMQQLETTADCGDINKMY